MIADEPGELLGLVQPWPLTVTRILEHADRWHGSRQIVSRDATGTIRRTTYAELHRRARQFAAALAAEGIVRGDRIATLAHNSALHMEAWYGIMGRGSVTHTLNPRLFDDQLVYIINHAGDRWIVADPAFTPLLGRLLPRCPTIERVVFLGDGGRVPWAVRTTSFERLIEDRDPAYAWGGFDELLACGLCYTSGTTGQPKGVLYSHRSTVLHMLMTLQPDVFGLRSVDVLLQIVPMFHASAWGLPFSAAAVGTTLVLPGPLLDGQSVYELLEGERVTVSAAVPTVWQTLLEFLVTHKLSLSTLKRVVIGGSACPARLLQEFRDRFGVDVRHAWGMTELSPTGTVCAPTPDMVDLTAEGELAWRLTQGRVPFGVDIKITDDASQRCREDGASPGHLKVRGMAAIRQYFRDPTPILDHEGYFDTGDIAVVDARGFMRITDRAKDLIKSGGEWISSVEIESIATNHPEVSLAAVIAVPHTKWGERPLLVIQLKPGGAATSDQLLQYLEGRIARWWIPDEVVFVKTMPLGPTGKIDKQRLRTTHGHARDPADSVNS